MAVDAGTVYAEIRIALEKLQGDLSKVDSSFGKLEAGIDKTSKRIPIGFQKTTKDITNEFNKLSKTAIGQFANMANKIQGAFVALPIIGFVTMITAAITKLVSGIGDFINKTTEAYINNQKELAKLNAVIQATGASSWTTTRQMVNSAKELASATGHTTDQVLKMQSVLLGYSNIIGEQFDRASKAIVDMAAVTGGDLASAANTVGVALDNPIRGMTSLSKQGFIFTSQQKELVRALVESGKTMDAQNIILKSMESTYKGVAAAVNDANKAISDLETAQERLKIAQGEATSGIKIWWAEVKTGWVNARLEAQLLRNALDELHKRGAGPHPLVLEAEEIQEKIAETIRQIEELTGKQIRMEIDVEQGITQMNDLRVQLAEFQAQARLTRANMDTKQAQERLDVLNNKLKSLLRSYKLDINMAQAQADMGLLREDMATLLQWVANAEKDVERLNTAAKAVSNSNAENLRNLRESVVHMESLDEIETKLGEATKVRKETLLEIDRELKAGMINLEEANKKREATWNNEASAVNNLITAMNRLTLLEGGAPAQRRVAMVERYTDAMKTSARTANQYAMSQRNNLRMSGQEFYDQVQEQIGLINNRKRVLDAELSSRRINQKQFDEQFLQAQQQAQNAIENTRMQYGILWADNRAAWNLAANTYSDIAKKTDDIARANRKVAQENWIDKYNQDLAMLDADEAERLAQQRINEARTNGQRQQAMDQYRQAQEHRLKLEKDWALEQLRASDLYKEAVNDTIDYNGELISMQEHMENIVALTFRLQESDPFDLDALEKWQIALDYTSQALQAVSSLVTAIMDKWTTKELAKIEELYKTEKDLLKDLQQAKLDELEESYQNQLYYLGLAKAVTQEHFDADLEAAIQSGNHRRIHAAESAKAEFEARKKYEEDRTDEEERQRIEREAQEQGYLRRKADIEHKAAMAQWSMQLALTTASVAQAIMTSYAQLGPIAGSVAAGIMYGIGTIQIAAVMAAIPEKLQFSDGGIVPGRSFTGDNIITRQNSGEMDITKSQQKDLWDAIESGEFGSGTSEITVIVNLDGKVIAQSTGNYINDRHVLIKVGSVVK